MRRLGRIILYVKADFYQDIANPWDFSPLQRRDLDDDLKEFLYESISEIPNRHTVVLNFHLPRNLEDSDAEARSVTGIRSFLEYTLRTRKSHLKEMLRTAVAYALMGVLLLITAVILQACSTSGRGE
jgi:transcriptional regulator of nitric oxide reductase